MQTAKIVRYCVTRTRRFRSRTFVRSLIVRTASLVSHNFFGSADRMICFAEKYAHSCVVRT